MSTTGRWVRRAVWAVFVAVMTIGCSPLTTIAFLFHNDEKLPAECPLRPKEGPKHEKDQELVVLILCSTNTGRVPSDFIGLDRDLAHVLSTKLTDTAKENKEKLTVLPAKKLQAFKDANPNWKSMKAASIGKRLGADVVLELNLGNLNIYQPNSGNQFYQGRATVDAAVYDTTNTSGEKSSEHTLSFDFPKTQLNPVENLPIAQFKKSFIDHLAQELVRKHLDYTKSDAIAASE